MERTTLESIDGHMTDRPFRIAIPDAALIDLRARLEAARWPASLDPDGWDDGAGLAFMRRLADHWLNRFDWRAQSTPARSPTPNPSRPREPRRGCVDLCRQSRFCGCATIGGAGPMSDTRMISFLPVDDVRGRLILAAMRDVAAAGAGLGPADEAALMGAATHVLGLATYAGEAEAIPVSPPSLACALATAGLRRYACELIAVMAFVDGAIDPLKIRRALTYAQALGVDDDYVHELAEAALGHIAGLAAEMNRNNMRSIAGIDPDADVAAQFLPYDTAPDAALAARFDALAALPFESFGHAFYDHYRQNGYAFPGEAGGLTIHFAIPHDSAHLLSGYSTSPEGEILVSTFTAAMHRAEGMSGHILPVIFTYHLGVYVNAVAGAKAVPLAGEKFWRAWERGRSTPIDTFGPDWDFWSLVETPIAALREDYRVPVLEPELAADGLPAPVRPWT